MFFRRWQWFDIIRASDLTREAKGKTMVEFLNMSHLVTIQFNCLLLFLHQLIPFIWVRDWFGSDDTIIQLTTPVLLLINRDRQSWFISEPYYPCQFLTNTYSILGSWIFVSVQPVHPFGHWWSCPMFGGCSRLQVPACQVEPTWSCCTRMTRLGNTEASMQCPNTFAV